MKHLAALVALLISTGVVAESQNESTKESNEFPSTKEDWLISAYNDAKTGYEKRRASDQQYLSNPFGSFFVGDLKLIGEYGYTNTNNATSDTGTLIPVHLDKNETAYKVKFGWFDKKIFRDYYLLSGTRADLNKYRNSKNDPFRWAFLDAFKFTANYGYGKAFEAGPGFELNAGDVRTKQNSIYSVGMKYEVPLSKLTQVFDGIGGEFTE